MKNLLSILLLLISLAANAETTESYETKEALMHKLAQVDEFNLRGVVEVPYFSLESRKRNIVLVETAKPEEAKEYKEQSIGHLGEMRESAFDYYDSEKDIRYNSYTVGQSFVCFDPIKRKLFSQKWGKAANVFSHCFIFPKNVDEVVEALKALSPITGPR